MNSINISGIVENSPEYSHTAFGERFYKFNIRTKRKSEVFDEVPCVVSEFFLKDIIPDSMISVVGEIRSRNYWNDGKRKMEVNVLVKNLNECDGSFINHFELHGYVCKQPTYRETPMGRQITDIIVASNRVDDRKADYLPCIAWGRNAMLASHLEIGTELKLSGRFQSREYTKQIDGEFVVKTAYELSLNSISVVERK